MNVRELSPPHVASCRPEATLAYAAGLLDEHDCGILPVVDETRRVIGVITDRDICLALAAHPASAARQCVREVMSTEVHTLSPADTPNQALRAMRSHHVRRLPIVDAEGTLEGILSLNDLAVVAQDHTEPERPGPTLLDVALTLKALCAHRRRHEAAPRNELIRL